MDDPGPRVAGLDPRRVRTAHQALAVQSGRNAEDPALRDAWERLLLLADEEDCVRIADAARAHRVPLRRGPLAPRLARGDRGSQRLAEVLGEVELRGPH